MAGWDRGAARSRWRCTRRTSVRNDEGAPEGNVEGLVDWVVYAWVRGGRSGIVSRGRLVDAAGLTQALSVHAPEEIAV